MANLLERTSQYAAVTVSPAPENTRRHSASWSLIAACACSFITALCVVLMLAPLRLGTGLSVLHCAMAGSTGFVAVAALSLRDSGRYGWAVSAALCFCWLGDGLGPADFNRGALMFAFAHLCFIAAWLIRGVNLRRAVFGIGIMAVVSTAILYWVSPHVPRDEWWLVAGYTTDIALMAALSFGVRKDATGWLVSAGAIIFLISDLFVARWHYVTSDHLNALGCYPLYYLACLLFAWSVRTEGWTRSQGQ